MKKKERMISIRLKKKNQIKIKNQKQTKNLNIEKESNIKTIKKLQGEKDTLEKQISDLKNLILNLETNLHRQQNNEAQLTEQAGNPQTEQTIKDKEKKIEKHRK